MLNMRYTFYFSRLVLAYIVSIYIIYKNEILFGGGSVSLELCSLQ